MKLGDIFHASPVLVGPPTNFAYYSANLNGYQTFRDTFQHQAPGPLLRRERRPFPRAGRRRLEPDPALHTGRDAGCYDLGTGAELFAYAPRATMQVFKPLKDAVGPQTKRDEWTVDGAPTAATCSSTR